MKTSEIDYSKLLEEFEDNDLEWRVIVSGETGYKPWAIIAPYVTNRAIQSTLDSVFGVDGWYNEYKEGPCGGVLCGITVITGNGHITKWDGAANAGSDEDMKIKGGLSASMKRAAVQWGIGRYLYSIPTTMAIISNNGSHKSKTKKGTSFKWSPPLIKQAVAPAPSDEEIQKAIDDISKATTTDAVKNYMEKHVKPRFAGDALAEIRAHATSKYNALQGGK